MKWTNAKTAMVVGVAVIAVGIATTVKMRKNPAAESRWADRSLHLSPFTMVRYDGDKVAVKYEGTEYTLVEINDLTTEQILEFCRQRYQGSWQKRFSEDLAIVLLDMGHPVNREHTVSLTLIGSQAGDKKVVEQAMMTEKNRAMVRDAMVGEDKPPRL